MDYIEKIAGLADNADEAYRLGCLARLAAGGFRPGALAKAAKEGDKDKGKGKGKSLSLSPGRMVGAVPGALLGVGRGVWGVGSEVARDAMNGLNESAGKTKYDLQGMELDALRAEYLREAARLRRAARVAAMPAAGGNSVRMRL